MANTAVNSCSDSQTSCHSPSWMVDETICCESNEVCQLAPYTVSKSSTIFMPFCCPKASDSSSNSTLAPCLNLLHGSIFSPPPCPTDPPHRRCNHNTNADGKFGVSWCCPEIPGVYCGQTNKQCLFSNPLGGASVSTSASASTSATAAATGSVIPGDAGSTSTGTHAAIQKSSSNPGLANGVKAAIGVSVAVIAVACIVGLIFLFKRRQVKQKEGMGKMSRIGSGDGVGAGNMNKEA